MFLVSRRWTSSCGCLPLVGGFYVASGFALARTALVLWLYAGALRHAHYMSCVQILGTFCTCLTVPVVVLAYVGEVLRMQKYVRIFCYCLGLSACHDAIYLLWLLFIGAVSFGHGGALPELAAHVPLSHLPTLAAWISLRHPLLADVLALAFPLAYLSLVFYLVVVVWSLAESLRKGERAELLPRQGPNTGSSNDAAPQYQATGAPVLFGEQGFIPSAGRHGAWGCVATPTPPALPASRPVRSCDALGPRMAGGAAAFGGAGAVARPTGPFPSLFANMTAPPKF